MNTCTREFSQQVRFIVHALDGTLVPRGLTRCAMLAVDGILLKFVDELFSGLPLGIEASGSPAR